MTEFVFDADEEIERKKWEPKADPPGWKSKAKFHEAAIEFGRTKIRLRSETGRVTLKFA